jgi:hypothetical protein
MDGIFPDSPAKLEAQKAGKPYFPATVPSAGKSPGSE